MKEKKSFKQPKSTNYGLTNKCHDGLYVLFADFDKIYLEVVIKDLKNLINRYPNDFTNFAIFESSEAKLTPNGTMGSFHAVNFSKFPYQLMQERLSYLSVDRDFYKLPKETPYRANTLRVSPKFKWHPTESELYEEVLKPAPKFLCWFPIEKLDPKRGVSNAHLRAYELLCGLPKFSFAWKREDNLTAVQLKRYDSARD